MPHNIGNKKYCTPWKQNFLTYDFQNYSSLGKEKTLNEIEKAIRVWQNVCNLKFERVFDGSQVASPFKIWSESTRTLLLTRWSIKYTCRSHPVSC